MVVKVVKAATKKKLMDLGCPETLAHWWAYGRMWNNIILMNFDDIMSVFSKPPEVWDKGGLYWSMQWQALDKFLPTGVARGKFIYDIVRTIRENELERVGRKMLFLEDALANVYNRDEPFIADYPPSWCENCDAHEPLIDGFCKTCETRVEQIIGMRDYMQKIEAFGMIPVGSRYSYLREDSQNFMNWRNKNPFEIK